MAPSTSERPSSRASTQRPPSSMLQWPPSGISVRSGPTGVAARPTSRISQRQNSRHHPTPTEQSSRLLTLSQDLVTRLTELTPQNDTENFSTAVGFVTKNLECTTKSGLGPDISSIDRTFRSYTLRALVDSQDVFAEALELSYSTLKSQALRNTEFDQELKMSTLPDHLQFLIMLCTPPSLSTLSYAETYVDRIRNPREPPPSLTWKEILAEEPFEGQHWEGAYGLALGSVVQSWDTRSEGSTLSLSSTDDPEFLEDIATSFTASSEKPSLSSAHPIISQPKNPICHDQRIIEIFRWRQYWGEEWRIDARLTRPSNNDDALMLGGQVHYGFNKRVFPSVVESEPQNDIDEPDAVREILVCLQDRQNLIINYNEPTMVCELSEASPRLMHFSLLSQQSILASFAMIATTIRHLRRFILSIFSQVSDGMDKEPKFPGLLSHAFRTRTVEAFSEAVDHEIRNFDLWCATTEDNLCRAHAGVGPSIVVSLLSLHKKLQDAFGDIFTILLEVLKKVLEGTGQSLSCLSTSSKLPSAATTTLLLDSLSDAVEKQSVMGDRQTSEALIRVFVRTAGPIWTMVGRWLVNGMPSQYPRNASENEAGLEDELFIEDNELTLLDAYFWSDGYTLRTNFLGDRSNNISRTVPVFLASIAQDVLETGKAIGLLRALGVPDDPSPNIRWQPFDAVLQSREMNPVFAKSLSDLVYDEITPICQVKGIKLIEVLIRDFNLMHHLSAVEDLYFLRREGVMYHFIDILFAKMDSSQPWYDFHFLNAAFCDAVDANDSKWINTSLVRLSCRGDGLHIVNETVKAIDGLRLEYAVPFPLSYIFSPRNLELYNFIFTFLLQIRRAKTVLERIFTRGMVTSAMHLKHELRVFYAMRTKLSWFINTILNFFITHVIDAQVAKFHAAVQTVKSLDEMVKIHERHLENLRGHCFLSLKTSALHRAILSILDICLQFSSFFASFAGDSTHDISQLSVKVRRHRSRRQKLKRRNVVGFSLPLRHAEDSSEDSSDEDDVHLQDRLESSFSMSVPPPHDQAAQLEKLSVDLNTLVRFIRRGVESLAREETEIATGFEVLTFALEDWDS